MLDGLSLGGVAQARQEARVARQPVRPTAPVSAPAPVQAAGKDGKSEQQVKEAVQTVSEHVQSSQRTLQFSVDKASGSTVVRVIDSDSKEVIRQIPSEEMLVIASRLDAATKGVLLSEQA